VCRALRNFLLSCVEGKIACSTSRTLSGRFRHYFSPCPDPEHFRGGVAEKKILGEISGLIPILNSFIIRMNFIQKGFAYLIYLLLLLLTAGFPAVLSKYIVNIRFGGRRDVDIFLNLCIVILLLLTMASFLTSFGAQ